MAAALGQRRALPTYPQQKQQTKKTIKPRFKVDHAAWPMPETRQPERLAPGRHQIGTVGEIISESWARSNRYTRARSSESAKISPDPCLHREIGSEPAWATMVANPIGESGA